MNSKGLFGKKYIDLSTKEFNLENPGFNDVIVRVKACGLCGTDINFISQWTDDTMPLGHEISGEVVEVGEGVKSLKPGDRVIVEDCSMCGNCDDCKSGRPDLCRNMTGLNGQPGMSRYLLVRYNNCVKFEGLDFIDACLTEPLAVSLNSVINADIPLNGSVVVIGGGPIGLMAARVAKLRGAGFVALTQTNTHRKRGSIRAELATKLGTDLVIDPTKEDLNQVIKKYFPHGVDRVIVTAPPEAVTDAIGIIRYGGIITFLGLHFGGRNVIPLDLNYLIFNKITLQPYFAEPAINFNLSLDLLKKNLIPAKDLITHTFSFQDAQSLFNSILEGSEPIIKAVFLP
ncbi:MAG: alcohol dehydrogenase catalytic domain-containing protein [Prolixibacteraceae bacterium]|nr:alcohol dehydrogenase catalytic domain-containing protein [Prolixibacteraceae bacterium]